MASIKIIYYSTYGHVQALAKAIAAGVAKTGAKAELLQVQETLPDDVLAKMGAPPKDPDVPVVDLKKLPEADGYLLGFPTRFGMMASQFKSFFDATGGYWMKGSLRGKPCGLFTCTGTLQGGQETTLMTAVTQLTHHGMIFVPLGYPCKALTSMEEIHGGSPWGSSTFAGADGSRTPTALELEIAEVQGEEFAKVANALKLGREAATE